MTSIQTPRLNRVVTKRTTLFVFLPLTEGLQFVVDSKHPFEYGPLIYQIFLPEHIQLQH